MKRRHFLRCEPRTGRRVCVAGCTARAAAISRAGRARAGGPPTPTGRRFGQIDQWPSLARHGAQARWN